ncbi:MAG: DUF3987 domain-containing protein [Bdellovibrionota bacterium]
MNELAYRGIAGDYIKRIEDQMECDPIATLVTLLTCFGNIIGRKAHFHQQGSDHFTNIFSCLVGNTAKARKGTSFRFGSAVFRELEPDWYLKNIHSGLSSGEGFINPIRDADDDYEDRKQGRKSYDDAPHPGVSDKRMLVKQEEFAATFKVVDRSGNNLTEYIREAWDSGNLQTMTKRPLRVTNGHISIIGHITKAELLKTMAATHVANGFGNRFLWFCVRRRRMISWGTKLDITKFPDLLDSFRDAITFGREIGRIDPSQAALEYWDQLYQQLSPGLLGTLGMMTSRSEPQVLRLAMIYALLDCSPRIEIEHIRAGLAIWEYAENSARYIWGNRVGNPVADQILKYLKANREGVNRKEIHKLFNNNRPAEQITQALSDLVEMGFAVKTTIEIKGRRVDAWKPTDQAVGIKYYL